MKQFITFIATALISLGINAQTSTNLVFFSEQGEQFLVVLNGVQQNFNPQTNVKVTDLIQPYYKVKIRFIDGQTPDLDKTINFNPGTETTFALKKNKKGEYVLRWLSEVPIAQAPQNMPNQNVVVYTTTPAQAPVTHQEDVRYNDNTTITNTTNTTNTTIHQTDPQGGNVSMGISVNDPVLGVNMNVNVNASETGMNTQNNTTTYSQTTTTTTTHVDNTNTQVNRPVDNSTTTYSMPGYSGAVGCAWPMDETAFSQAYNSIKSKDFESSKLTVAKQVINNNCLTSDQVKRVMLIFDFETTRLDFAKHAYGYTYDIGNYYLLNDAFTFESSIDDLNNYISGFRR